MCFVVEMSKQITFFKANDMQMYVHK